MLPVTGKDWILLKTGVPVAVGGTIVTVGLGLAKIISVGDGMRVVVGVIEILPVGIKVGVKLIVGDKIAVGDGFNVGDSCSAGVMESFGVGLTLFKATGLF